MEQLKLTAAALCATMVLSAVILMLTPERENGMMRFAVRIFFLLSILLPVITLDADDFTLPDTVLEQPEGDLGELAQQQLESAAKQLLCQKAEAILESHGVEDAKAEMEIHIDGEDSISITSLRILIDQQQLASALAATASLNESFGVTATLVTTENEDDGKDKESADS